MENIFKTSPTISYAMPEQFFITGYISNLFMYDLFHYDKFITSRPIFLHLSLTRYVLKNS